ncbi:hypothetical protein ARMSODRAFT_1089271 [Armillaria solidipes]|uniref:Family A G protein-coupled receptor-like protein n=1 Tax=Armillaria solidipes TaxID=1076256 RepID=A0A2H3BGD7_9AGAR|nr:hypothetical protein ARMSODRAFT_1089271 [Armillaria solidipes]
MESPPADLSQYERDLIFDSLDLNFNRMILESLFQGMYTLIVAITLWTTFSAPKKSGNSFLLSVVITLYVLTTVAFGVDWAYQRRAFIQNGENFFTVFFALQAISPWWNAYQLVISISGGLSTFIVDVTIIWRCWVLWGRQWRIVLIPGLCAIVGTIAKSLQIHSVFVNTTSDIGNTGGFAADIDWALIYLSLTLATTLLCTILIVYRIVRLSSGISSYRKIVEIVIESSAMYSLTLIAYLALVAKNLESSYYADIIMAYIKVIAPTLLIGRVAAGSNSSSSSEVIVNSTRDRSSVLSRFMARKQETDIVYQDVEDSTSSLGSYYGKSGMESA